MVEGYVYFIYIPELYQKGMTQVKIGHTKNLDKRLRQLQTGNPFKLSIYKTHKTINYKQIEHELHVKYKSKKVLNEWFQITLEDVDNEMEILNPTPSIGSGMLKIMANFTSYIWKKIPYFY